MLSKQLRFIVITLGHTKILMQFQNNQRKHITHWKFNAMFPIDSIMFDMNILAFNLGYLTNIIWL